MILVVEENHIKLEINGYTYKVIGVITKKII